MKSFLSTLARLDLTLLVCTIALTVIGTIFIHSAGSARTVVALHSVWRAHAVTAALGLAIYLILAHLDYRRILNWTALPFYAISLAMLVAVLIFGAKVYGGRRWLWFFQPSEVAKLAVIMITAKIFAERARTGFKAFLLGCTTLGVPVALILVEPDLGTALVLVPAALTMLLAARVWTRGILVLLLAGTLAVGAALGTVYVAETTPDLDRRAEIYSHLPLRQHQIKRLRVFLFPDTDIHGAGYNLRQAEISIGSGSVWGKGIGQGAQKFLGYLPPSVSMNDFIFAVLAEESGFVGSALMLLLFLGYFAAATRIAFRASDDGGRLLAIGVSTLVFCHVYVNVAMSIGLMPITGLPLPFISAGRTFLVILMAATGLLQSVAVHREEQT